MGEQMLLGILRTPYPDDNIVLATQFIGAARQAADEIERLRAENAELIKALSEYASHGRWMKDERHHGEEARCIFVDGPGWEIAAEALGEVRAVGEEDGE